MDSTTTSPTPIPPPPPPYAPPADPSLAPSTARHRPSGRQALALGAAAVLLVGTGAAGSAVAVELLGPDDPATGTDSAATETPSTTSQDDSDSVPQVEPFTRRGQGFAPDTGSASGADAAESADATDAQSTGIVQITSTLTNGSGAGTGLVLDADGTIVTNHHVVAGATSLEVTVVSTGETYQARYVGGDAVSDIAVLQLEDAGGLTPVDLSDDAATVGDEITAVGDAGGDGGALTASPGTVTALGQDITVRSTDGSAERLTDLIQLDAYVVPGDSGGAVLDEDGEVVGMNVAASSGTRDVTGYAIPVATVASVVAQIESGDDSGDVELGYSGYLGVGLDPTASTPLVAQVIDGTAAEEAGLATGDTITRVDGASVGTADELRSTIAAKSPGEEVTLTWTTSGGASRSATVTLGEGPVS